MPVTATSYEALAVDNAISMLAASATFQTLVGAANATAAKARILRSWGGTPELAGGDGKAKAVDGTSFTLAPPFAHVHMLGQSSINEGVGSYSYSGTAIISILQVRRTGTDTPAEQFTRAANILGAIRGELEALFGSSNSYARGSIDTEGPEMPEETGADGDSIETKILIHWEA